MRFYRGIISTKRSVMTVCIVPSSSHILPRVLSKWSNDTAFCLSAAAGRNAQTSAPEVSRSAPIFDAR